MQHRLQENSAEIYKLLEDSASVYVCGDATRMAKDVSRALAQIMSEGCGVSYEEGENIVKELRVSGRYQVSSSLRCVYCNDWF